MSSSQLLAISLHIVSCTMPHSTLVKMKQMFSSTFKKNNNTTLCYHP